MSKYNITEFKNFDNTIRFHVDVVDIDKTRKIGVFDTREEAEERIAQYKGIQGTTQPTWIRTREENVEGFEVKLKELEIEYTVYTTYNDAVIEIPTITQNQFEQLNTFMMEFKF